MDTDSFVFSFTPNRVFFKDWKHLSKDLHRTERNSSLEIYSEDKKTVKDKMKLESSPKVEKDEAVFSRSNFFIITELLRSVETKQKGVQSQKNYTMVGYEKTVKKKVKTFRKYLFVQK